MGTNSDPHLPYISDTSGQRTSPVPSSDNRHLSSSRNTSNIKNFESTLRGIESLHFSNDKRLHY
ncbi:hypothetical protein SLEP1_g43962 [Rubroshorea leprosula]|uniref:Uncharacterized protein n=1 Tax=Rubroshorea leprosula TaxID=152421 RepID=A0AAV5LFL1_9ROSI|nr:hypothetical protein SLEP1_g43962 [Rubroshorea leprosula]